MLIDVLRETKNFFVRTEESGIFEISYGKIYVKGQYQERQYIAITGSVFNDGIYRIETVGDGYIDVSLTDANYPAWVQPIGAFDAYPMGARVAHNSIRFVSLINANTTVPGTGLYWEVVAESEHLTQNEKFDGTIYGLAIPRDFLELVRSIEAFQAKQGTPTNITSESFGVYSESRGTGTDGAPVGWEIVFRKQLNKHRRTGLINHIKI